MIGYVTLGTNDLDRAARFYDALLGEIGAKRMMQTERFVVWFVAPDKPALGLFTPFDGQPATAGNGCTIGFAMEGPEQAQAWHDAGVAAGGTSIEDPPGVREGGFGQLYLAYLRDPSGNKLCALHRM